MKYNGLILVTFVTVLVTQNEANPTDSLHTIDQSVVATTNYLKNMYTESFKESTQKTILAVVQYHRDNISDNIEKVFTEFKQKFAETENDGKSVDQCRTSLKSKVNTAHEKIGFEFDRCIIEHAPNWESAEVLFEATISEGEQLLAEIKKFEENCHSEDDSVQQKCIFMKLPEVGQSVGLYKRNVAEIRKILVDTSDSAIAQTGKCLMRPLDNFEDEIVNAKKAAVLCIEEVAPAIEGQLSAGGNDERKN